MADKDVVRIRRPVERRAIPGFAGRYSITCDGRVWSHAGIVKNGPGYRYRKGRWLKSHPIPNGYLQIALGKAEKKYYIHHLVITTWGPPKPSDRQEVNHIDGNKRNNIIANLEWVTRLENDQHARITGLTRQNGEDSVHAKLTEADVLTIRKRHANGERAARLAREFGVGPPTIIKIVKRQRWRHI